MNLKPSYYKLKKYRKAYLIIVRTQKYIDHAKSLIELLNSYSKYPVILYYANGEINYDYDNLIIQPFDVCNELTSIENFEINNKYNTLTKPAQLLNCIDCYDLDSVILLDSDILVTPNIDRIFDYECFIENYPIFIKYPWNYININGFPLINEHAMELMNNPTRSMYDVCTCMCILNKNCKEFLKIWSELCSNEKLINFYFYENKDLYFKYNDEHIANGLLWKYRATKQLPSNLTHVISSRSIEFVFNEYKKENIQLQFHDSLPNTHYEIPSDFLDSTGGFSVFPKNEEDLWGFHGVKDPDEIEKSTKLIKSKYYAT